MWKLSEDWRTIAGNRSRKKVKIDTRGRREGTELTQVGHWYEIPHTEAEIFRSNGEEEKVKIELSQHDNDVKAICGAKC